MTPLYPALEPDDLARRADRDDPLAAARARLAKLQASGSDDTYAVERVALPEEQLARRERHPASDEDAGARGRRFAPAASCGRAVAAIEIAAQHGGAHAGGMRHRADASASAPMRV